MPEAFLLTPSEMLAITDAQLSAALEAKVYWGAFQDGRLVGFAALRAGGLERLGHTGDVGPLFVDPAWRRRGLGAQILSALQAHAREIGLKQIELTVDRQNKSAFALYLRAGFRIIGIRPRSVLVNGLPRDDVMMLQMLDQPKADGFLHPILQDALQDWG
nr:GNAT family N-acetyltransferase [Phaeobacter sp.]